MAKAVANLSVSLLARTGKFDSRIKRSGSTLQRFVVGVRRGATGVLKFGTALTTVAAGGLALLTKRSLEAVDALAKTSDKLGVTTESLRVLQEAAKLTGVSTRTFDMALQRMTRRLSEAAQGTGEAKAAIKELGLSATELSRLAPDEQFKRIADAMNQVSTQADRVRLSFKLFDSEGVAVVNTLKLGSKGIDAMGEKMKKLGLLVTREGAAKVEQANDALDRLGSVIRGVGDAIGVGLSPFITASIKEFEDWAKAGRTVGDIVSQGLGKIVRVMGVLGDWFELAKAGWLGFAAAAKGALLGIVGPIAIAGTAITDFLKFLGVPGIVDFRQQPVSKLFRELTASIDEDTKKLAQSIANFESGVNSARAAAAVAAARAASTRGVGITRISPGDVIGGAPLGGRPQPGPRLGPGNVAGESLATFFAKRVATGAGSFSLLGLPDQDPGFTDLSNAFGRGGRAGPTAGSGARRAGFGFGPGAFSGVSQPRGRATFARGAGSQRTGVFPFAPEGAGGAPGLDLFRKLGFTPQPFGGAVLGAADTLRGPAAQAGNVTRITQTFDELVKIGREQRDAMKDLVNLFDRASREGGLAF